MATTTYSTDEITAFMNAWRPQLVYEGFSQIWEDTETGEAIDFSKIADLGELQQKNARAESQYFQKIAAARETWLARYPSSMQDEARRAFEREMCKIDPYYLGKIWLGYSKAVFHLHYFMAHTIAPSRIHPGYRGLREFARDSFKTTFMGVTFCVQQILRDPNITILYKSCVGENAAKKVQEIKNHFLRNELFAALFPEFKTRKVSEEGSGSGWRAPCCTRVQAENTITAAGVGSSKGGTSQHYDLIIGDDFWDEKSVTSPESTADVKEEMAGIEFLLATPKEGRILYIGTRFSHDDPTSSLRRMREYECIIVSGILACGRSTFPESMSISKFMDQAQNQYTFSCQVILNPTEENRGFKRSWFKYQPWATCRDLEASGQAAYRKVILTDAAGDDKKGSDPITICVVAIDQTGRIFLIDYIQEKMDPSAFIDQLFSLWDRWKPDFIVRQKTLLETTIMSFVERENIKRREEGKEIARFYHYSLGKREKKQRITASLQPLFSAGMLYFDPKIPQLDLLERALLEHPRSADDNGPDALSLLDDRAVSAPAVLRKTAPQAPPPAMSGNVETRSAAELEYRREQARLAFEAARKPTRRRLI